MPYTVSLAKNVINSYKHSMDIHTQCIFPFKSYKIVLFSSFLYVLIFGLTQLSNSEIGKLKGTTIFVF